LLFKQARKKLKSNKIEVVKWSDFFTPLDDRILLVPAEVKETTSGGLVIPESAQSKPDTAKVLSVGPGHRDDKGNLKPLDVKVGDEIKRGDKIAEIGATGRVTGPHLDWRFNWKNERLDPALMMQDTLANKK